MGSLLLLFALVTENSTLRVLHKEENLIASKHQRELNFTGITVSRAMQSNTEIAFPVPLKGSDVKGPRMPAVGSKSGEILGLLCLPLWSELVLKLGRAF